MVGKSITLRVQSREGTKRVQILTSADTKSLYEEVKKAFGYSCCGYKLHKDKSKTQLIISSKSKTVEKSGLSHGDIMYLTPDAGVNLTPSTTEDEPMQEASPIEPTTSNQNKNDAVPDLPLIIPKKLTEVDIQEDDIDIELNGKDGMIPRQRDPRYCKHGENAGCVYCCPLPPFDEEYLKEQKIKHLSFHSYLKKLTSGVDKGKFVALEDLSVRIKEGCQTHPPWPKGICSKCQPSAVTLKHQIYRHVDSVMFENPKIVERFLSYWYSSGFQRMGLLYGNYEEHTDVPLGIRARVAAIYEPPQENTRDTVNFFLNDEKLAVANEIAESLGLRCIGWVFTDLIPEDANKVKHIRGGHSFFMSAQECITAAYLQSLHPSPSKIASNGCFGSKFATIIITGDEKNQVHMEGYQVSNQCMALVRDKCLVPTKDAPELGYVKESTNQQYVPDVYYKKKDEYGNDITRLARPLPVEYLLVDVPVSTPIAPQFTFTVQEGKNPFPVENRPVAGHLQDFNALAAYLGQFDANTPFLDIACDFHFLVFIATMDIVDIRKHIGPLLEAIRTRDASKASDWAHSDQWLTVDQLIVASHGGPSSINLPGTNQRSYPLNQAAWTCARCTYNNMENNVNCEVCSLPRL